MLPSRKEIDEADVIIGVNETTGAQTIFYGKGLLSLIANGYEGPKGLGCRVLSVLLNFDDDSDEPEQLGALCLVVKGTCDAE